MKKYKYLLISALFFLLLSSLAFAAQSHAYFPIDLKITNFIQSLNFPFLRNSMILISIPGYTPYKEFIFAIITFALFFLGKRKESLFLIYIVLSAELFNFILKHLVNRIRPSTDLIHYIYRVESSASFPSGHVLFYVVFFGFLFFIIWRIVEDRTIRSVLFAICLFFVLTVGLSRIYLGAHWFSDVVGAYLAGFAWLFISIFLYNALPNEKSKNKVNI
jgi:membrane-associated phospholipid phosphatase